MGVFSTDEVPVARMLKLETALRIAIRNVAHFVSWSGQDRDERDFAAPVVSLSLGDTCLFRIGGLRRSDPTHTVRLSSGDALVLGGEARLAFHGVDRILPGTSGLLPQGGRINLTLRRVSRPVP